MDAAITASHTPVSHIRDDTIVQLFFSSASGLIVSVARFNRDAHCEEYWRTI
jgi:hypothetical protein